MPKTTVLDFKLIDFCKTKKSLMFRIIETTMLKRLFLLYLIPLETTVLKLLFILYLRPLETTVLKRLDGNFSKEFPHEALALNSLYCFPTIAITSLPFYSPLSLSSS